MYKVIYDDNAGNNNEVSCYLSKEDAEAEVKAELADVEEYFKGRDYEVTFCGNKTEIYTKDGNEHASWKIVESSEKTHRLAQCKKDSFMVATNIEWDIDDQFEVNLPTEINIPDDITDEEEISEYLSDVTGYCHKGYVLNRRDI